MPNLSLIFVCHFMIHQFAKLDFWPIQIVPLVSGHSLIYDQKVEEYFSFGGKEDEKITNTSRMIRVSLNLVI